MIVMLIVIGLLAATAIVMLLSVPNILKSNAANLAGHNNTSGGGRQRPRLKWLRLF